MLDEREAVDAALRWIDDNWRPTWAPAVAQVVDVGAYWRVFYNSGGVLETGVARGALGGNLPVLVRKSDGAVIKDLALLRVGYPKRS